MMGERMDRKKEERRNRILDVAERAMATKGVNGMTMEEVAREADVAIGTQYLYFRNKNSLCAAVIVRLLRQVGETQIREAARFNTGSERLLAYRTALYDFIVMNPMRWKAIRQMRAMDLSDDSDENVKELLTLFNRSVQNVAQYYRDGMEEGAIRPEVDPVPAAIFLVQAMVNSVELSPLGKAMLRMNEVDDTRWQKATNDLLTMATHTPGRKEGSMRRTGKAKRNG
jgi:AcrR family transcriptional regulator